MGNINAAREPTSDLVGAAAFSPLRLSSRLVSCPANESLAERPLTGDTIAKAAAAG